MNAQYIARMPVDDLARAAMPAMEAAGLAASPLVQQPTSFHRLLEMLRPRVKRLPEIAEQAGPLVREPVVYDADAVAKHLTSPELGGHIAALGERLAALEGFDEAGVEAAVRGVAAERGMKAGPLIHAVRVAVTGKLASPGLFEVLVWLGRDRTVARLTALRDFLASKS